MEMDFLGDEIIYIRDIRKLRKIPKLESSHRFLQLQKNSVGDFLKKESGSISLLIIGLFITALAVVMIVTDISAIAAAKRSLDHATEAAVQTASHTLDQKSYYTGKMNRLIQGYRFLNPNYYVENRIPINCAAGLEKAKSELSSWNQNDGYMKRIEIIDYQIDRFTCNYDTVSLATSARIKLPFNVPFSKLSKVTVNSQIVARNEKNSGFYLFGIRIL